MISEIKRGYHEYCRAYGRYLCEKRRGTTGAEYRLAACAAAECGTHIRPFPNLKKDGDDDNQAHYDLNYNG